MMNYDIVSSTSSFLVTFIYLWKSLVSSSVSFILDSLPERLGASYFGVVFLVEVFLLLLVLEGVMVGDLLCPWDSVSVSISIS